ncbi:unnamed protein product, partial [Pylaiella littoralis]
RPFSDNEKYASLGCFKDNKDDRILGYKMSDGHMTTDMCYAYCSGMAAPFMATQFGIECWCATEVTVEYKRHGEGADCSYTCGGNEDEKCGGYNALNLYSIEPVASTKGGVRRGDEVHAQLGYDQTAEYSSSRAVSRGRTEGALVPDIVKIIDVVGDDPRGASWADSYSVGGVCYMQSSFDHDIGDVKVETPLGAMTIKALYDLLPDGPSSHERPLYNDIQCGNGPANTAPDEARCPGLVEHGRAGCGQIGPMWDLTVLETYD